MCRDRKCQSQVHPARVMFDRRVEESRDLREVDNRVELAACFGARHAENCAVEKDVLASGQVGMEAGSHFEQTADASAQLDAAARRLGDAAQNLQQRALAGAVAADDTHHLAGRSEEHTSELQSLTNLVCRLLLEK